MASKRLAPGMSVIIYNDATWEVVDDGRGVMDLSRVKDEGFHKTIEGGMWWPDASGTLFEPPMIRCHDPDSPCVLMPHPRSCNLQGYRVHGDNVMANNDDLRTTIKKLVADDHDATEAGSSYDYLIRERNKTADAILAAVEDVYPRGQVPALIAQAQRLQAVAFAANAVWDAQETEREIWAYRDMIDAIEALQPGDLDPIRGGDDDQ